MSQIKLTGGEWSVLACLWEESPQTFAVVLIDAAVRVTAHDIIRQRHSTALADQPVCSAPA